jgi:GDPmannose 4,6-dehydratase
MPVMRHTLLNCQPPSLIPLTKDTGDGMTNYPRTAIITGISGQDGLISAKLLLDNGWNVVGVTRSLKSKRISELRSRYNSIKFIQVDSSQHFYDNIIETYKPDMFLHWGSPSSVKEPWADPTKTLTEIINPSSEILRAIAQNADGKTALMLPLSSEIFAKDGNGKSSTSERKLESVYAIGKSTLLDLANLYREKFDMQIFSPILFPHVSPFQSEIFFTGKIMKAIINIHGGIQDKISIGDLSARRDWSWAPTMVNFIIDEIQKGASDSRTIGSGLMASTSEIIEAFFSAAGISDWQSFFLLDDQDFRKEGALGNFALDESNNTFNSPRLANWSKDYVNSGLTGKFLNFSTN